MIFIYRVFWVGAASQICKYLLKRQQAKFTIIFLKYNSIPVQGRRQKIFQGWSGGDIGKKTEK